VQSLFSVTITTPPEPLG